MYINDCCTYNFWCNTKHTLSYRYLQSVTNIVFGTPYYEAGIENILLLSTVAVFRQSYGWGAGRVGADMGSTLILNDRSWTPICWGRGWGGLAVQTHSTANANIRYRRPPKICSPTSLERYWPLLSRMYTNIEMRHSCPTGFSVLIAGLCITVSKWAPFMLSNTLS